MLLAQGDENAGRREPLFEGSAARSSGRDPARRFPRGLGPSCGVKDPHGEERPAEIGILPRCAGENFGGHVEVPVRRRHVECRARRIEVLGFAAAERRDREPPSREAGRLESPDRLASCRSRHPRSNPAALAFVPKRERSFCPDNQHSALGGVRERLLRGRESDSGGNGGLGGAEPPGEKRGGLENRTAPLRSRGPRARGRDAALCRIETRREITRDVEDTPRIGRPCRSPGSFLRLAPRGDGIVHGCEREPEKRGGVSGAQAEGQKGRVLPGLEASRPCGEGPEAEAREIPFESEARSRVPAFERNGDEGEGRALGRASWARSVREIAQHGRTRIVFERAREAPEGASLVQGGARCAFHERRRLLPPRGAPCKPESGASDGRRGSRPALARGARGGKRKAEEVPRNVTPHAGPPGQLGHESLGSSARVGRAKSGDDVLRDVAGKDAVEGALDRTSQRFGVLATRLSAPEPDGGRRDRESGRHRAPRRDGRGGEGRPLRVALPCPEMGDVLGSETEPVKREEPGERAEPDEIRTTGRRVEARERSGTGALHGEDEPPRSGAGGDENGQQRMLEPHER